jgi:hypothetical protein
MIWFYPYRFEYPSGVSDAEKRLVDALQKHGLQHSVQHSRIKVEKTLGRLFRNSWNPIFVGRLENYGAHTHLRGYFRTHWFTLIFSILFLSMLLYQLLVAFQQPEVRPGYVPGWRTQEIEFTLTFIGAFFGITFIGWLFGLPNARRILAALRDSATAQPSAPVDAPTLRVGVPSGPSGPRRG